MKPDGEVKFVALFRVFDTLKLMSQESAVNYTVPSNVDCSSYFKSRPLQQWNRDDYVSYRRENGSSSLPDGKLIEDYNCEFTKLLASKDIPDESKRAMKSMQPMVRIEFRAREECC